MRQLQFLITQLLSLIALTKNHAYCPVNKTEFKMLPTWKIINGENVHRFEEKIVLKTINSCCPGYVSTADETCVPNCEPACQMHEICLMPNVCECKWGYNMNFTVTGEPQRCVPACIEACGTNAYCAAPNFCKCLFGFVRSGKSCSKKCNKGSIWDGSTGSCINRCNESFVWQTTTQTCAPPVTILAEGIDILRPDMKKYATDNVDGNGNDDGVEGSGAVNNTDIIYDVKTLACTALNSTCINLSTTRFLDDDRSKSMLSIQKPQWLSLCLVSTTLGVLSFILICYAAYYILNKRRRPQMSTFAAQNTHNGGYELDPNRIMVY